MTEASETDVSQHKKMRAESMQALSNPPGTFLRLIDTLGRRTS
jgi:hypothetical protein